MYEMQILLFDYKWTLSLSSGQMHLVGNNFTQEKRELLHTVQKHLEKCFVPDLHQVEHQNTEDDVVEEFSLLSSQGQLILTNCCEVMIKKYWETWDSWKRFSKQPRVRLNPDLFFYNVSCLT